jgi:hypothetical protein
MFLTHYKWHPRMLPGKIALVLHLLVELHRVRVSVIVALLRGHVMAEDMSSSLVGIALSGVR